MLLEGRKELPQPGLADLRLEGLGEGLPGAAENRFGPGQLACLLAPQLDQLGEGRGEGRKVVLAARLLPKGIAPRLRLRQLRHQGGIQAPLAFQFQPKKGQIAAAGRGGLRVQLRFGLPHQLGIGITALTLVELGGEEGELLAAPWGPSGRHHRVLVDIEGAADRPQQPGLVEVGPQALVGGSRLSHGEQRFWGRQLGAAAWPLAGDWAGAGAAESGWRGRTGQGRCPPSRRDR